jgi:hypothetical protein
MAKQRPHERLERFNVVLSLEDVAWIDQLGMEIQTTKTGKVSRSEVIRAAIAMLRELHRLAPAAFLIPYRRSPIRIPRISAPRGSKQYAGAES